MPLSLWKETVSYINDHPQRSLLRELKETPVSKIKHVDASVRRAIIRGHGYGTWIYMPHIGRVHSIIPAVRNQETLDTPEHRWLRLNLALILDRLAYLHTSIVVEIERYKRLSRSVPKRLEREEMELEGFVGVVKRLLALPVFDGVRDTPPPGFASLTLLGGIGYGDAYRAIMVLRLGLDVEGDPFELSVMDVHELYEAWCFIQLMRQVTSLIAAQADVGALLQIEETGIRVRLRRGEQSAMTCVGTDRTVVLSYNPEYAGLTGDQRPDIVLRFQHNSWPDLIIVFDAKYRLDASEECRKRFGTAGPPQDAINVLHRYRDAIVVDSADRGLQRPVVKGAALFPLTVEESRDFTLSRLFKAIEVLGIGALPFLPENTGLVEEWLKYLLALAPEELAEPGPSFAGLSEKYRRTSESTRA
jgi:PD-(D/E)XK nuclease superfamily/Domain of unknown function (DUF2357)